MPLQNSVVPLANQTVMHEPEERPRSLQMILLSGDQDLECSAHSIDTGTDLIDCWRGEGWAMESLYCESFKNAFLNSRCLPRLTNEHCFPNVSEWCASYH